MWPCTFTIMEPAYTERKQTNGVQSERNEPRFAITGVGLSAYEYTEIFKNSKKSYKFTKSEYKWVQD